MSIDDLLKGSYVVEDGWTPNYVKTAKGEKVSRVNILGIVVGKDSPEGGAASISIDDGTGTLNVRTFDDAGILEKAEIGQPVMVIGRPRVYSNEIYVFPEIVSRIENPRWINVRKLELRLSELLKKDEEKPDEIRIPEKKDEEAQGEAGANKTFESADFDELNETERVFRAVKELDKGEGADIDEVIRKSGVENAEEIISTMLRMGDLFEVAGKIKVLE